MIDFEVYKYQKIYRELTLKHKKNEPSLFELGLLIAYTEELKKGFGVVKQLKTTSKGTAFNYERLDTKEKVESYNRKIEEIKSNLNSENILKELAQKLNSKEEEDEKEDRDKQQ